MTVSLFCPHCHKHTALSAGTTCCSTDHSIVFKDADWKSPSGDTWWIGICNGCGLPCLVKNQGEVVYPHPRPSPTDKKIPKELARDLDESKICLSVDCYRACAAMARRCIQNACLHKGTTAKDLVGQIAELADKGVITKDIAEWATVVRWVGNDAAHPGKNDVKKEDAEDCLRLAEQFLHVISVTPAVAKARRAARGK
jgi:hypothetical protein